MAVCDLSAVSVEKRIREEQAWHLRKAFQDLLFRFQDWLWAAELMAASPNSSQVSYANSKKELQRFKVLQRQVSDKLLPLESLNRRYHQLVRSGSIGPQLRPTVQKVNQRWDELQARTAAICKRLKHFVNQWEKFELEKETIRVWLVELDLRLTDVEHFSAGTSLEKMIQLQAFEQDVQASADRVDRLLVHGEALIQKSQPEDAEVLEEELRDLSGFCQEVFRRVFRFQGRLVSMRLVFEDEWLSDRGSDLESESLADESLERMGGGGAGPPLPPAAPMCQSTPKNPSLRRQQPAPPVEANVDLEWDPSVDIGGSTSHDEEDSSYFSAITGMGQWEEPRWKCKPPACASRSLPLRCGSREDLSGQNGFREEWEQFSSSVTDQEIKRCSSVLCDHLLWRVKLHFRGRIPTLLMFLLPSLVGTSHSWELQGCQHPQNGPPERGSPRQAEPMGFDPERIETWLGQSCREKMGGKLEVEQVTGTCGHVPLPVLDLQFPVQSQASGKQPKRQRSQQRARKKTRPTPASNVGQICKKDHLNSRSAEIAVTIEQGSSLQQPPIISCLRTQKLPRLPAMWNRTMMLLSASLLLLLLFLASPFPLYPSELSCLQENGYSRSFHLMLTYSGPPPT
ncbi:LOW QUALITY PROTEIN: nesprin-4 [Lacerta agilis]|uniref:LOW QUALITY PROTEIN: nesprin-4 n=1 Tax=Lacerta agilis TaxID=80427 RepID=UPI00141A529C|nr:LOW QUALITY PROTEIN: nesprin-4 [Lacerta agilis]